jgi:hypothetical protein
MRRLCQRRYNVTQRQCELTFMDRQNTAEQRAASLAVLLPAHLEVGVLDAFDITDGQCTATADGRHYPRLLAKINHAWLTKILEILAV